MIAVPAPQTSLSDVPGAERRSPVARRSARGPTVRDVVEHAADPGDPLLSSLDALHLASAVSLGTDLSAFVCYDRRLAAAAAAAGLDPHAPGA